MRARGIEKQNAESVARPAIITKKAFEAGLLDAGLFVDAADSAGSGIAGGFAQARVISLRAAQDGIDERGGRGKEVEGGKGAAIGGLQERLSLGRGPEQLVGAVRVVTEQFNARRERAAVLAVSQALA